MGNSGAEPKGKRGYAVPDSASRQCQAHQSTFNTQSSNRKGNLLQFNYEVVEQKLFLVYKANSIKKVKWCHLLI